MLAILVSFPFQKLEENHKQEQQTIPIKGTRGHTSLLPSSSQTSHLWLHSACSIVLPNERFQLSSRRQEERMVVGERMSGWSPKSHALKRAWKDQGKCLRQHCFHRYFAQVSKYILLLALQGAVMGPQEQPRPQRKAFLFVVEGSHQRVIAAWAPVSGSETKLTVLEEVR